MEKEMIDESIDVANRVAMSMLGVHYKFGGNTPAGGIDCSGFALVLVKALGIVGWRADMTAAGLHDMLIKRGGASRAADKIVTGVGKFIFYGREKIVHVGWFLNNWQMVSAQGGGKRIFNLFRAGRANAFVKVLPWWYRADVNSIVDVRPILSRMDFGTEQGMQR